MKRQILLLLGLLLSLQCYSQVNFENGYFIDNTGKRNNVLIKNVDWKNNPVSFEYKTSENAEAITANISMVREFGINNNSKYHRANVKIDRSSEKLNRLSTKKEPVFHEEELFLEVLVEGKADLYEYIDGDLRRYFYKKGNDDIEQLVYKVYSISNKAIRENKAYQQQLYKVLDCPSFGLTRFTRLKYQRKSLVNLFREYHECQDSEITFEPTITKPGFDISLRPRTTSSSLAIGNGSIDYSNVGFGSKNGFGIGLEAELTLPFNRNKWSIILEPTYQYYANSLTEDRGINGRTEVTFEVDYKSIELPLGARHYFFLNNNSKLFLNASFVWDFPLQSTIIYNREDGSTARPLEINGTYNIAMGLGFKYAEKYSLELRYFTNRNVLENYNSWFAEYESVSIILGYTLF